MKASELIPYCERLAEFITGQEHLPDASMLFAGDGFGQVRPHIGIFMDQPEFNNTRLDGGGQVYHLPFQIHLIILPEARLNQRNAMVDAMEIMQNSIRAIRNSHQFDELTLAADEPISIVSNTADETIISVNYVCSINI